jgi:hypothetical protein
MASHARYGKQLMDASTSSSDVLIQGTVPWLLVFYTDVQVGQLTAAQPLQLQPLLIKYVCMQRPQPTSDSNAAAGAPMQRTACASDATQSAQNLACLNCSVQRLLCGWPNTRPCRRSLVMLSALSTVHCAYGMQATPIIQDVGTHLLDEASQ